MSKYTGELGLRMTSLPSCGRYHNDCTTFLCHVPFNGSASSDPVLTLMQHAAA